MTNRRPYNSLKKKRRRAGERPNWAPIPVDADAAQIHPLPDWVLLEEIELPGTTESGLAIARPLTSNTTYGFIRAIHPKTGEKLGVSVGDEVIFSEWQGSRWRFNGETLLMPGSEDILAKRT